jgi:hypothetical protein
MAHGPTRTLRAYAGQEHVAGTECNRQFVRFPLCYWLLHYSGIARVNTESMVKPLRGPYNSLHYGAVATMLQGEQLANARAVHCQP